MKIEFNGHKDKYTRLDEISGGECFLLDNILFISSGQVLNVDPNYIGVTDLRTGKNTNFSRLTNVIPVEAEVKYKFI